MWKTLFSSVKDLFYRFYSRLDEEDKVVFARFIIGVFYGFIAYIMYRYGFILIINNSYTIWFFSFITYLASGLVVGRIVREKTFFLLMVRGLLTFFLTWIIVAFILFDLFG